MTDEELPALFHEVVNDDLLASILCLSDGDNSNENWEDVEGVE